MKKVIASVILVFSITLYTQATIIHVEKGTTYPTITSALAIAMPGDTLNVYGVISKDGIPQNGIVLNMDICIQGQGKESTYIEATTEGLVADRRIFTILAGNTVTIKTLSLRFGHVDASGGAIENLGTLNLNNCSIYGCQGTYGGAIRNGIGATLNLYKTTIEFNSATERGGGINHIGEILNINNCRIENNEADEEGGGIQIENANSLIVNSSIGSNKLTSKTKLLNGMGIFIGNSNGNHVNSFVNVTIFRNKAYQQDTISGCGGGIGLISTAGRSSVILFNCTIAENEAACGKGIQSYTYNDSTLNEFYMSNCIIANGTSDNYFDFSDEGKNLIYRRYTILSDSSIAVEGDSNLNGTDPQFDHLSDIPFEPSYYSLLDGSPAIDAGTNLNAPEKDQRGATRIGQTDIGAFEYGGVLSQPEFSENTKTISYQIFPNPSKAVFNIISQNVLKLDVFVYDQSGKLLLSSSTKNQKAIIDIGNYPSGIYFLKLIDNMHVETAKLIKY